MPTIRGAGGVEIHMSERSYELACEGAQLKQDGALETSMEIRTSEIREGDWLDHINGQILRGPRGGKYRFDGVRVQSRVAKVGLNERGRFAITPSTGVAFVMPGNSADLTTCVVRRKPETEIVRYLDDNALLAACESDDRATKLAAEAELARRTS